MMERVANDPKYQDDYYAEEYHHWQVSPPGHLYEIEEFERQTNVELPIEYVYYLTQVGRGGAAPGTYFEDFYAHLIVSGPLHGRVVYLDYNRDLPPIWPKGSPKFLESIQQPEYQKAISEVLQYFTQKSVKSEE